MNKISRCIFLNLIFVVFLATQFIPYSAIAGGKWKQVPADETRIVLKGWPEAGQFKYYKGWHTDDWSMECESTSNYQGHFKTYISLCRTFPGYIYVRSATDIINSTWFKWKAWKGSEMKPGQNTTIRQADPRKFIHAFFTQSGKDCQFMAHNREAGIPNIGSSGQYEFRPRMTILTCNTENKFEENNIRIDDANEKVIISYPGKQQQAVTPARTIKKSTTETSTTSNSSTETSPLEKIENKCTQLGFKKGTEKHGDCVMKLYK